MKTLSERISDRASKRPTNISNFNRAQFLAIRKEIQLALDDGWSLLAVYRVLHDETAISFSYQAFRRYANELLLHKGGSGVSSRPPHHSGRKAHINPSPPKFIFESTPNAEELI